MELLGKIGKVSLNSKCREVAIDNIRFPAAKFHYAIFPSGIHDHGIPIDRHLTEGLSEGITRARIKNEGKRNEVKRMGKRNK